MTTFQRPALAATAIAAGQFLLTASILLLGLAYAPPEAFGKIKLLAFASSIILPLILVQALGMWRQIGLGLDKVSLHPVFLASLLTAALFLCMGVNTAKGGFAGEVLMQFLNAFGEEVLFRGVIFAVLLTLPRWQAIALSGVLFGSMHLMHGFMDGNWGHALWQVCVTAMAGTMFASVRYATGSLWLTVLLHMILNLCMIYSNIEATAGPDVLFALQRVANAFELALAAYVIFKMRTDSVSGKWAGQVVS
jgi:membrane protease YdiL (CAAX protease family)